MGNKQGFDSKSSKGSFFTFEEQNDNFLWPTEQY